MNEEIWFVENQFPWFVMDDDSHGFWLLPKENYNSVGEKTVKWSEDCFYGDECFFCKKPNTGDWLVGIEDAICVECREIWEYDDVEDSYIISNKN